MRKGLILLFVAISCCFAELIELSKIPIQMEFVAPNRTQVFVITDGNHDDVLKTINITESASNRSTTAYEISRPDLNGKLTPFIPTNSTYISISTLYGTNYNVPGYIYIANTLDVFEANVYVQRYGQDLIIRASGTNIFFPFNVDNSKIPVVLDLSVPNGSSISGFVGIPEDNQLVFDSSKFDSTFIYNRLEFPVKYFYLKSLKVDVHSYTVATASRTTRFAFDSLSTSGLLMTQDYIANVSETQPSFSFSNNNNAVADAHFYAYVNTDAQSLYETSFTFSPSATPLPSDEFFQCSSHSSICDVKVRIPLKKISIHSYGQYAIQYSIRDSSQTIVTDSTQNPVVTTRNPAVTTRNPTGSTSVTRDPLPTTGNPSGPTQNPGGTTDSTPNPVVTTSNAAPTTNNISGSTQNPAGTTQNFSAPTQNPSKTTQNHSDTTRSHGMTTTSPSTTTSSAIHSTTKGAELNSRMLCFLVAPLFLLL